MQRLYLALLEKHLKYERQMLFLTGPRQVGKTTIAKQAQSLTDNFAYLNWDYETDQQLILQGPEHIQEAFKLNQAYTQAPILMFDEIHKFPQWRNYLKGYYDKHQDGMKFIITGSAKLDVYRYSGDSLMGRYFPYRVHPLSVAELLAPKLIEEEIRQPKKISQNELTQLLNLGGFPEPFHKQTKQFSNRWRRLKMEQLFEEDLRDLQNIQHVANMKLLAQLLKSQVGQLVNYHSLAKKIRVTTDTTQKWITILSNLYFCFLIKPWSHNISRSLLKQPKLYLWDWSDVPDEAARKENFVASHLLKAVHFWTDYGFGDFELYFLRDKEQREVDFLVTKNQQPWFLVEVKSSNNQGISKSLHYYQQRTNAKHAFQVVFNEKHINKNLFEYTQPIIVPVQTLLSQLV